MRASLSRVSVFTNRRAPYCRGYRPASLLSRGLATQKCAAMCVARLIVHDAPNSSPFSPFKIPFSTFSPKLFSWPTPWPAALLTSDYGFSISSGSSHPSARSNPRDARPVPNSPGFVDTYSAPVEREQVMFVL
jgi:hypothetical protein